MPLASVGLAPHAVIVDCRTTNSSRSLVAAPSAVGAATPAGFVVPAMPRLAGAAASTASATNMVPEAFPSVTRWRAWVWGGVCPDCRVVGENLGTQVSPCSSVNGPHFAVPTVSLDGTQLPFFSAVPGPQSTLLQPLARVTASAGRTMRRYMGPS